MTSLQDGTQSMTSSSSQQIAYNFYQVSHASLGDVVIAVVAIAPFVTQTCIFTPPFIIMAYRTVAIQLHVAMVTSFGCIDLYQAILKK